MGSSLIAGQCIETEGDRLLRRGGRVDRNDLLLLRAAVAVSVRRGNGGQEELGGDLAAGVLGDDALAARAGLALEAELLADGREAVR